MCEVVLLISADHFCTALFFMWERGWRNAESISVRTGCGWKGGRVDLAENLTVETELEKTHGPAICLPSF